MASSAVEICNRALIFLGVSKTIQDLENENSKEARVMRQIYDDCRKDVLEAHDWGFARGRKILATSAQEAPSNWAYRYAIPANCIAIRSLVNPVGDDAPPVPFDTELLDDGETSSIVTDLDEAEAYFTRDITDPNRFTSLFRTALARLIASNVAFAITGKNEQVKTQATAYEGVIASASASDASQRGQKEAPDADWVKGRL
jgi:hypothetical protein